jgi:glycosyltransferase involved in cell wall biosynthesis
MPEKEIVFFTHLAPLPPTGGGTRSYHILKSLSDIGNVSLVVFNSLDENEKKALSEICNNIFNVNGTGVRSSGYFKKLLVPFKFLMPFLMSNYELNGRLFSLQLQRGVKRNFLSTFFFNWFSFWFTSRNYYPFEVYMVQNNINSLAPSIREILNVPGRILVFDFNFFLPALSDKFNLDGHRIICNSHNVEFDVLKQTQESKNDLMNRAWNKMQAHAMEKAEKKSLMLSDKVFCCSIKDKELYHSMVTNVDLSVVPNGVDTTYFSPSREPTNNRSLLFTGTMSYGPNILAVKWFINEVFPELLKKYTDLLFIVAGKEADKLLLNHKNIRIVSSPKDIRPCFREACVYIVPLQQGGGTRLKIMEAAAMAKPVISTTLGAEGLEGLNSNNIILADTPSAFVNGICALLEDQTLRNSMSKNLNCWVKQNYSWNNISQNIIEVVLN